MVRSRSGRRWTGRLTGLLALGLLLGSSAAGEGVRTEHFFLTLIAILIGAKLLGEVAERFGQPAVLGELIAGVLIGSSVLGILPTTGPVSEIVHLLAEIGVAILLFEIGLETDLKEMFRVGGSASVVALVGVAAPFLMGFGFWYLLQPSIGVTAVGISPLMVAVFVGATLTATSVGITARVLTDLNRIHTREARVVIGAAVVDDVLGLVILAIVSGLAAGAALTIFGVAMKFVIAAGFLVAAVLIGNFVAPRLFGVVDSMRVRGVLLVAAFCFALLFAALAGLAGSAVIIGAFAAGIVLSSTNQFDEIEDRIAPVADIFTPIFFVSVGAGVNVNLFLPWSAAFDGSVLLIGGALLVIAIAGKVLSGYAVGWGREPLNHLAIGVGMIPRGEVGLIFAHLGLANGILTPQVYSAILIMVIFTTFLAPPLLKPIFGRMDAPQDVPGAAAGGLPGTHAPTAAPVSR
jgi:Kef-type K+ transport system membrane component KefB